MKDNSGGTTREEFILKCRNSLAVAMESPGSGSVWSWLRWRGFTEPSAVAPDAKLNSEYSVNPSDYHHPNLSLASGATALGSVMGSDL